MRELAVRVISDDIDFWVPLLLAIVAKDIVWFNRDRPGAAENALVVHRRILLYHLLQWHSFTGLGNHATNYCDHDDEQKNYSTDDLVESVFVPRLLGGPFRFGDFRLRKKRLGSLGELEDRDAKVEGTTLKCCLLLFL